MKHYVSKKIKHSRGSSSLTLQTFFRNGWHPWRKRVQSCASLPNSNTFFFILPSNQSLHKHQSRLIGMGCRRRRMSNQIMHGCPTREATGDAYLVEFGADLSPFQSPTRMHAQQPHQQQHQPANQRHPPNQVVIMPLNNQFYSINLTA